MSVEQVAVVIKEKGVDIPDDVVQKAADAVVGFFNSDAGKNLTAAALTVVLVGEGVPPPAAPLVAQGLVELLTNLPPPQ